MNGYRQGHNQGNCQMKRTLLAAVAVAAQAHRENPRFREDGLK
jgi:hypothetical protein